MGACSSPTTWVLGVELGFSGLVAGVLTTQQAASPAPLWYNEHHFRLTQNDIYS